MDDDCPIGKSKSNPKLSPKSKRTDSEIRWVCGGHNSQGRCKYNEDRCVYIHDLDSEFLKYSATQTVVTADTDRVSRAISSARGKHHQQYGYFGVYDGHDGVHAAAMMAELCHIKLRE